MAGSLILIANPGSASRKYALYDGGQERAQLHFEWTKGSVHCTLQQRNEQRKLPTDIPRLTIVADRLEGFMRVHGILQPEERINSVGLRIVAPSNYFLEDRLVDDRCIAHLKMLESKASLHISATLAELEIIKRQFSKAAIIGVSDSAFHMTKPDYAWNYGIPLEVADRFEIKRFGYHGLSLASAVRTLKAADKLPPKVVICHIGSGVSVTALHGGLSVDTTMGYSPLDGVIMATRSGSIDPSAVNALKDILECDNAYMEEYLNTQCGLLGLGGSDDMRELLERENNGDHIARLAVTTYVYALQKAVGQMAAALGGVDSIVFTGTVGERSAPIRQRIIQRLHYLDFVIDEHANKADIGTQAVVCISRLAHSKPIYVVAANEAAEMIRRINKHTSVKA